MRGVLALSVWFWCSLKVPARLYSCTMPRLLALLLASLLLSSALVSAVNDVIVLNNKLFVDGKEYMVKGAMRHS